MANILKDFISSSWRGAQRRRHPEKTRHNNEMATPRFTQLAMTDLDVQLTARHDGASLKNLWSGLLKVIKKCLIVLFVIFITSCQKPSSKNTIGIIQFVEHPALDQTRKGIIDYLQEHDPTLVIQWESAQGNSALSTQIAQRFVGQKVSAIVTIATVPSQAALQAAQGTTIPVIFASVSDPQGAKLTGNITGVSNYIDAKEQFMFFKQILPRLTTLGIIYNPGEPNSVSLNALMEKRAQEMGLKLVFVQAPRTSEVSTAAQSLVSKVDAIFINNDSTALAAFESIIAIATTYKIPVFASDIDVVKKGALAVLGPNQYYIGTQAGAITQNLVKEKALASTIDVEYPHQVEVYLNQKIADALGIVFDPSLQATTILKE